MRAFLFKQEIFKLCEDLKDLTIIDDFNYYSEDSFTVDFTTFKSPVIDKNCKGKEKVYCLKSELLSLEFKKSNKENIFDISIREEETYELDTIFMYSEVNYYRNSIVKYQKEIRDFLKKEK